MTLFKISRSWFGLLTQRRKSCALYVNGKWSYNTFAFVFLADSMCAFMRVREPLQWFDYHWSTTSALVELWVTLIHRGLVGTTMAGEKSRRSAMDIKRLAGLLQRGAGRLLVIDSRTFSEYNASHVHGAVNVCCSKLVKRRLQQDKVSVTELLQPNGKVKVSSVCLRVCVCKQSMCNVVWLSGASEKRWMSVSGQRQPLKSSVYRSVSFWWISQPCHFTVL